MILSTQRIAELLNNGTLKISPEAKLKEAAIKMHLSVTFGETPETMSTRKKSILKPKGFILALSKETISLPKSLAGLYDGYTHLARQGVITHMGSMFVYPGTNGRITFEIFNASDKEIILEEDMRIGHIVLLEVKE